MKLSFLPGDLHLTEETDGTYLVTMHGQELLRTRTQKKAIARFNAVRTDLEFQFPARELSAEEKRSALENLLLDYKSAQVRASTKPAKKEKITGTRTFG